MADPVTTPRRGLPPPTTNGKDTELPPPPEPSQAQPTYRGRFGIGYLVLAVLVAGAGVGAYSISTGKKHHAAAAVGRSFNFNPIQQGELGAIQIARFVQHRYRGDDGKEIVGIVASRPQQARRPIQEILVEPSDLQEAKNISKPDTPTTPFYTKDIMGILMQNGIMYQLCGLGPNCSIKSGQPSNERARFLRVEALELALRTFRNDADVRNVVVFLPPLPPPKLDLTRMQQELASVNGAVGALLTLAVQVQEVLLQQLQDAQGQTQLAMYFRRSDMEPMLRKPLLATLPLKNSRNRMGDLATVNTSDLDAELRPFLFQSSIQSDGAGNPLLILQPVQQQ